MYNTETFILSINNGNAGSETLAAESAQSTQAEENATHTEIKVSPEAFVASLPVMAKGMLGIFLVTLVIIFVITILNKAGERSAARKKAAEEKKEHVPETEEGSFE